MSDSLSLNLAGSSVLDEETARAELYGLLAQLYYARPTPDTLAAPPVGGTEAPAAGGVVAGPWTGRAEPGNDMGLALRIRRCASPCYEPSCGCCAIR